ncbi:MAG: GGDEF domain-containing protein [Oscillospiraceae bacterium]|nr:GGDEF domain-containing protein [Oscillospiraceae bacterium]MDY6208440.1 GGDEF domain-containing protein [Oscillospiraceae bacterium]
MIKWFIEMNFPTLIILVYMSAFLMINSIFPKKINIVFGQSLVLTVIEMAAYCAELWTASLDRPTTLRIFFSAVGYSVRPMIIYLFVMLLLRDKNISKRNRFFILLPIPINMLVAFSAFFTDIAYSYDASNNFVRGPLGFSTHIVCTIYLIAMMVLTIKKFCNKDYSEGLLVFLIVCVNILAMLLESFAGMHGVIRSAYSLSIVLYSSFFCVENFKRDSLTGARNRRCLYIDSEKHKSDLTAVVSVDLNDLKKINDIQGHAKGDEAICAVVNTIEKVLSKGCTLYRTGGDEFMILCSRTEQDAVEKMLEDIRSEIKNTPYTCALGAAYITSEDFDRVCARADAEMYKDKQKYKSLCGGEMRI